MTTLLTSDLIDRCHAGSRNKGFWDEVPPQGQQLMLVISELCESLEAHRKGKRTMPGCLQGLLNTLENVPEYFETRFVANVKDTVEDELADAYIRLCDFIGGFQLDRVQVVKYSPENMVVPKNFAEALLRITCWIVEAHQSEAELGWHLSDSIACIENLCHREGIDLATHIDLKLRYNATRPAKHGKAY